MTKLKKNSATPKRKSRGTALGGKYSGIYEKTLATGEKRYLVRVSFRDQKGKRQNRSETVDSLQAALKLKKKATAKVVTGQLSQEAINVPTLGEMITIMTALKHDNRHTADNLRYLQELEDYFGRNTKLDRITEVKIRAYKDFLDRKPKRGRHKGLLSNRSKDHRLIELRHLLKVAHQKGRLKYVPLIRLYGRYGSRHFELDLEKFSALVEALPSAPRPHKAIILLGWVTGMRKSDLLTFKWEQYRNGQLHFQSSKTAKRGFVVSCPEPLAVEISRLEPTRQNAFMFVNPKTGKPYTDLKKPLETASRKVGLEKPVTLHMLRHLAGNEVAQITGNEMLTQRYIGWSSAKMVREYTHIDTWTDGITEAMEQRFLEAAGGRQHEKGGTPVVPFEIYKKRSALSALNPEC